MKRLIIILLALVITTTLVFARLMPYNRKQPPRLPLQDACSLAMTALGTATNQFYCLSAQTMVARSPDGEWLFEFTNTNGAEKHVFVFFDKTTQIVDGPLAFY
jgi:hypothetical protein